MSKLCSTPGCPAPYDPKYSEWHRCWAQGIKGHKCFGGLSHCHLPKKGMGGYNPASKIVACLCQGLHDAVDNGFKYGNAVILDGEGREVYRLWEVTIEPPGKTLIERVIGKCHGEPVEPHPEPAGRTGDTVAECYMPVQSGSGLGQPQVSFGSPVGPQAQDPQETAPADLALAPTNLAIPSQPAIRYERRALVIEGPLSWERYEELCATLETMEEAVGFWIGDAIIRGEQEFGERAYQPWTAKGYKAERLRQYAWVASHVGVYARKDELSFTYHREVAALPEPEQVALLDRAEAEHLSTRELREIVKGAKPEETCHHSWKCELCGASLRGR